ncbi:MULTISPECIES: PPOX class F420-dependent oxidoreductase [Actinoalloteichus]|uniref:PPOX class putative F420-dependent enzyme n=1 Tax=Actinoalloteichus fjordicus TaxID=1612552 RepID=A0AAC9L886_9PSEU|nr:MULTISPECIES: PPOX class F420-dependent oxidoreductase [Actinoalloteichus]APU12174.1 PPOX class putative F420-dependent enzyme [Actinoalloteichus fjordicus]APU18126.1 PPOX class putative F420-dependent enzyme [Actinoalloteichus sp. GBA129-24]
MEEDEQRLLWRGDEQTEADVEHEVALAKIREQHRAVLATARADGTPQMSPVLTAVDEDGRVLISTRRTTYKVRNVRRDARVWLCVLPDEFFGGWLQIDGRAEVLELPEAMPLLEQYYRQVSGEHPDWAEYREAMRTQQRVILRVTVDRAGPKAHD